LHRHLAGYSFHVRELLRFLDNPGCEYWEAAKRVLRFLKGTKDWKLKLGRDGELRGYSNANWGGDIDMRKSTSRYMFCIGNGAVS
jgi:hypothetical protein